MSQNKSLASGERKNSTQTPHHLRTAQQRNAERTIYTFLPIRSAEMMLQSIEFPVYIESMCSTLNYKNRGLSQKK